MVQLMPLPSKNASISCLIKIQTGFTFLVPAYLECHGKKGCKMGVVVVVAFIVKMPAEQPLTSVVAEYGSVTAEVAADSSDTDTVVGA